MNIKSNLFLLILFLTFPVHGYSQKSGSRSVILFFEMGAFGKSIGSSAVSRLGEAETMFYNPAALVTTDKFKILHSRLPSFNGLGSTAHYYTIAYESPSIGTFGLSYFDYTIVSEIIYESGSILFEHTLYYRTLNLSLARAFFKKLNAGVGVTYYRSYGENDPYNDFSDGWTINNYSFNVGILGHGYLEQMTITNLFGKRSENSNYDFSHEKGFSFGIALLTIGPLDKFILQSGMIRRFPQPLNLRFGISWQMIEEKYIGFNISLAAEKELVHLIKVIDPSTGYSNYEWEPWYKSIISSWKDDGPKVHRQMGAELKLLDFIYIRAGIERNYRFSSSGLVPFNYNSYGIGFGRKGFRFSYAVTNSADANSVWTLLTNPGKFTDYEYYSPRLRAFTLSILM